MKEQELKFIGTMICILALMLILSALGQILSPRSHLLDVSKLIIPPIMTFLLGVAIAKFKR